MVQGPLLMDFIYYKHQGMTRLWNGTTILNHVPHVHQPILEYWFLCQMKAIKHVRGNLFELIKNKNKHRTGPPMFELIKNLHATAWYRHAHVCLSKRSLLFPPFLKRQAQLYIIYAPSKTMAYSAACIPI